jgi:hypothetical protein
MFGGHRSTFLRFGSMLSQTNTQPLCFIGLCPSQLQPIIRPPQATDPASTPAHRKTFANLSPSISSNIRRPRKSLRIRLAVNLGNAVERAIALTVAEYLSAQSGQHVGFLDLVGLSLYVWSDDKIQDASDLAQYLQSGSPLQELLVRERKLRSRSPQQQRISEGLLSSAGVRLELAIA